MDYYEIGQRIRKYRKALGLSQEALAEKVNISKTYMSHIETGNTKLGLPVLVALSEVLEVRADDILFSAKEAKRSSMTEMILNTIDDCDTTQLEIIFDIIKATKTALKKFA